MNFDKNLINDLRGMQQEGRRILEKYEDVIVDTLRKNRVDADESLRRDILFDILQHTQALCDVVDYMQKEVVREGILGHDAEGNILMDGEILPLMTEVEVYIFDTIIEQDIWTRAFVGGSTERYLVGLDRDIETDGRKVRIRG